ncbi:DsbA family protein [Candidatus Woesearchaeota archaeon]|nr:DsbA family protein [Candidatus Woesearchaeota archaeon]
MKDKKEAKKTKAVIIVMVVLVLAVVAYAIYVNIGVKNTYPDVYIPKPYAGNTTAKVVLTEYSDFECPACGYAEPIVRTLRAEFKDDVAFRFVHFPLTNIHPNALSAAEASECANDQGKFWEYHDKLYENQKNLGRETYLNIAKEVDLNMTSFTACLDGGAKKEIVLKDLREAISKNLRGTPSFFVNDIYVENYAYENIRNMIKEELQK